MAPNGGQNYKLCCVSFIHSCGQIKTTHMVFRIYPVGSKDKCAFCKSSYHNASQTRLFVFRKCFLSRATLRCRTVQAHVMMGCSVRGIIKQFYYCTFTFTEINQNILARNLVLPLRTFLEQDCVWQMTSLSLFLSVFTYIWRKRGYVGIMGDARRIVCSSAKYPIDENHRKLFFILSRVPSWHIETGSLSRVLLSVSCVNEGEGGGCI